MWSCGEISYQVMIYTVLKFLTNFVLIHNNSIGQQLKTSDYNILSRYSLKIKL